MVSIRGFYTKNVQVLLELADELVCRNTSSSSFTKRKATKESVENNPAKTKQCHLCRNKSKSSCDVCERSVHSVVNHWLILP